MSSYSDINMVWLSYVTVQPGMQIIPHTHDYFHLSLRISPRVMIDSSGHLHPPLTCFAPNVVHGGSSFSYENLAINCMFLISDKVFYKEVERFPFRNIPDEKCHRDLLLQIVAQAKQLKPSPAFINSAFSYYLHLLLSDNQDLVGIPENMALAECCMEYINTHYAQPITLDDLAQHISRSRAYTSYLFSETYGTTLIEYLNRIRIQHACHQIAYTDIPIETIYTQCGFTSARNFYHVFMQCVGISPKKYRTSHRQKDLIYTKENVNSLKSLHPPCFTYVVNAQKEIEWENSYDYLMQTPSHESGDSP